MEHVERVDGSRGPPSFGEKDHMLKTTNYLTTAGAARILGVTPATVRQMVQRQRITPATTTDSGIRLFDPSEVERLAAVRATAHAAIAEIDK